MSNVIIYTTEDGAAKIELRLENGTVWLSQAEIAELFQTTKQNISKHIQAIFDDQELDETATVNQQLIVQNEGDREVSRAISFYNLDVILAVGYRVRSVRGVQFRRYASTVLKEYLEKGFALNDERLKNLGGGNYWKELLDRIRDIRSSEKVMYRQVLDLYATSADYNPKSAESIAFFKMVQNKLHYAAHGHTAAEVIYDRADSSKPFMGLTSFSGDFPQKKDVVIAKNYLDEKELKVLNNIVSGYFDFAENMPLAHTKVYMEDYVAQLVRLLSADGRQVLEGTGKISHKQAVDKAIAEYRKYEVENLSPVEEAYLETVKKLEKEVKTKKA